ncbi:hypothetical protein [Lacticaseibacillus parakribbianus]|uniref:hypothetical protein n=1 Tax=Lacticaseibacillus parakribbianus TaxID=2970927 RepID=UPI0021CB5123|nr:hypothetical protein [Lacticaseibacillus parakribbianus]
MEITSLERAVVEAMRKGARVSVTYFDRSNTKANELLAPFAVAVGEPIRHVKPKRKDQVSYRIVSDYPFDASVILRQGPPEPKPEPDPVGEKIDHDYDAQF